MSRESMWNAVRMAWAMLARRSDRDVRAGRPREPRPAVAGDEPRLSEEGFAEEALPWLDAVYRCSLRLTNGDRDAAEDLAQETFLRAHRFWHTYEGGTRVKSWLFTICRPGQGPGARVLPWAIDDEVVDAIDDLPEEFREVLVLSDLGDLKYAEMAEVLDIPVGTVKSRLFPARKLLQERLRDFAVRSGCVQENA
jgi:RNA polymerase sigma-70 factor, ECF subfamily